MPASSLQREDPGSPDGGKLIAQLDEYLSALYPAASNHLLSVESLRQPNVTFLVARVDDRAAGCGAFVDWGECAEIKRMYVPPEFRAMSLGRRILEKLESLISELGLTIARLETGIAQPEALRLFDKAGYTRRGPFGAYRKDPLSIFMEKTLIRAEAKIAIKEHGR